jgi:hypothetical protein
METAKLTHYWWMDKENVVFIYNGILFCHKEKWNLVLWKLMNGTGEHHLKWS